MMKRHNSGNFSVQKRSRGDTDRSDMRSDIDYESILSEYCREDLNLPQSDTDIEIVLCLPHENIPFIIGKGGRNVDEIVRISAVRKLDFQKERDMVPGQPYRKCHLWGTVEALAKALFCVGHCLQSCPTTAPALTLTLLVAVNSAGFIIGQKGSNVDRLQKAHNVRIQFEKEAEILPQMDGRKVAVTSKDETLENIVTAIAEIIVHARYAAGDPFYIDGVDKSTLRRGCENLIQNQLISYNPPPPPPDYQHQRFDVMDYQRPCQDVIERVAYVPEAELKKFIGRKEAALQEYEKKTGVRIEVEKENPEGFPSRQVFVIGHPNNVAACCKLIEHKLAIWAPQEIYECEVPVNCIRLIIGSQGAGIDELQHTSGVFINFSRSETGNHNGAVVIQGTPANIRYAKQLLDARVQQIMGP